MTAAEYRIIREQARSRIAASQRFDRDAVKAMLVDALDHAGMDQHHLFETPQAVTLDGIFNTDDLATTVIEWFGGKGAA